MLKAVFLIAAVSTAFANPALDDPEFWPLLENPSDLSNSANLEDVWDDATTTDPDQNLFMDSSTNIGEYFDLVPQLNAAYVNINDGSLAGLDSPPEALNTIDPFDFGNEADPREPRIAQPPFPVPDCGKRELLCCSGKAFGAGLYSKCNWCMPFNPYWLLWLARGRRAETNKSNIWDRQWRWARLPN